MKNKTQTVKVEITATPEQLTAIEISNFDFSIDSWVAWDFGTEDNEWGLGPCAKVEKVYDENEYYIIPEIYLRKINS